MPKKPCLYKELDLCLAPCEKQNYELRITNYEFKKNYSKNIKNLVAVLQGKKTQVLKDLQKEMKLASQKMAFEKAKVLRDQIWALENVFSHSHIFQKEVPKPIDWQKTEKQLKKILYAKSAIAQSTSKYQIQRIEGYDISNIQGQQATGSMVVFENGIPNKNEYRKFKIKITDKPNDTAMLKETISRRLKHKEWPMPQVMLIDGGIGQLNTALKLKTENEKLKNIKIISLAKRKNELFIECQQTPVLLKNLPQEIANLILHLRDESHRFAIAYHKKLRTSSLFLNHKS